MDHIVYVDAKSNELENLISKKKIMIIRGATGRKLPYDRVFTNDILYFVENNGNGNIKAKAIVKSVINSEKLSPNESIDLVKKYQNKLQLTDKQFQKWAGKRYLVLIDISDFEEISPFVFDKSAYSNMDDWLPVGNIEKVKK